MDSKADCTHMLCQLLDQKGDSGAAILSLVERYISHFTKRYSKLSFHEQQDIHQEVAIKLLCNGYKVREHCSRAWVYTVVRNQCINYVRKQVNQQSTVKISNDPEAEATAIGPTPFLSENADTALLQQIDCLQKVFDEIEAQETGRADIMLYTQYAFGFSYDEISTRSRRTVGAIGHRISVLKSRLKQLINECC